MTAAVVTIGKDGLPVCAFQHPDPVQAQGYQRKHGLAPALVLRIEDQEVLSATAMSGVTRKALLAWAAENLRPEAPVHPDAEPDEDDDEPEDGPEEADDDAEAVRPPPAPPAPRAQKPRAPRLPPTPAVPPEEPMSTKAPARATCTIAHCPNPPGSVQARTKPELAGMCGAHRKKVLDSKRLGGLSIQDAVAAVVARAKGEAPAPNAARAPKPAKKPPVRPMRMPAAAPAGDDLTTMFREAQEALSLVRVMGWDVARAIAARLAGAA